MKLDYENDSQLAEYLELSKKDLHTYYESHYANQHLAPFYFMFSLKDEGSC